MIGVSCQSPQFVHSKCSAPATVTITNNSPSTITIYRIKASGDIPIGMVVSGMTVTMSPLFIGVKLRAVTDCGINTWEFLVDQATEMWTMTPSGWSGSVGFPHSVCGKWIGNYPGFGDEIIDVVLQGSQFVATKITGDTCVPAGQITWNATIGGNNSVLQGQGQLAHAGFCGPYFVAGTLSIISDTQIVYFWTSWGTVTYRRYIENTNVPIGGGGGCCVPDTTQQFGSNLVGQWIGFYCGCGDEIIQIDLQGGQVVATKVTGDNYVPAGQVTWKVTMSSATQGSGQMQLAHPGYRNPYWQNTALTIKDQNNINCAGINYRRKVC